MWRDPGRGGRGDRRPLADLEALDLDLLRHETDIVGYPILPLVHQLAKMCGEAGRYVHWGATTQDIMDSAVVLQVRDALALIEADIAALRQILAGLAERHRDTPMAGRTHLQQALPVTFGYKAAVWLSMFDRHAERLAQLRPRVLVGQLAGAAGTLASLGDAGLDVQRALMEELGLGVPAATWHVARDGLAEAVSFLGLVTGSLGKIAYDVMLMASTELAEVYEPFVTGRGASSTMPQKRNPISSELMLAAAKAVRQHAGLMLDAMIQDFERATGPWHAEWIALPDSFVLSAGALHQAKIHAGWPDRRRAADAQEPRPHLRSHRGRSGDDGLGAASGPAASARRGLRRLPQGQRARRAGWPTCWPPRPEVARHLDRAAIERLTDPANYLGAAPAMVDRVLAGRPRA